MDEQRTRSEIEDLFNKVRNGVFVKSIGLLGELSFTEQYAGPNEESGPYKWAELFLDGKQIRDLHIDFSEGKKKINYTGSLPFRTRSGHIGENRIMVAKGWVMLEYDLISKKRTDQFRDVIFPF